MILVHVSDFGYITLVLQHENTIRKITLKVKLVKENVTCLCLNTTVIKILAGFSAVKYYWLKKQQPINQLVYVIIFELKSI